MKKLFMRWSFIMVLIIPVQNLYAQSVEELKEEIRILRNQVQSFQSQIHTLENRLNDVEGIQSDEIQSESDHVGEMVDLPASPEDTVPANELKAYWDNGLKFQTADGQTNIQFGGRIQTDMGFFLDDNFGEDGVEFRRARLFGKGLIGGNIEYKAEFDFVGGDADFNDVYIGFVPQNHIPGLRFGYFKEPFGLEELTSTNYMTFMERGLPNIFTPSRNTGVMVHNDAFNSRMTYAAGVYRETDDFGSSFGEDSYNVTGRLTALPYYEGDGERLVHTGIGFSYKDLDDTSDRLLFSPRPEANLADRLINTEFAPNEPESQYIIGAELAGVYGPLSLQGEYMFTGIEQSTLGNANFQGYYIQGSYFLTGEHKNYKNSQGAFDRVSPQENFNLKDGGFGAWEIALRYSFLDLEDRNATVNSGDEIDAITAGLNWYMNPFTRIMLNYTHAELDNVISTMDSDDIVQMRFQIDF